MQEKMKKLVAESAQKKKSKKKILDKKKPLPPQGLAKPNAVPPYPGKPNAINDSLGLFNFELIKI